MIHSLHYPVASILLFEVKMGGGKITVVGFGMVILLCILAVDLALTCVYIRSSADYCYPDMFSLLYGSK
jgi:hypothetical protein